jgi:parallel beta-helix repeat protein
MFRSLTFTKITKRVTRSRGRQRALRPTIERLESREVLSAAVPSLPHVLDVGSSFKYATIQAAVNDAKPFDTVQIHTGTYQESVVVSTPHLTITAAPGNSVVIENPAALAASSVHAHSGVAANLSIGIWATADPLTPPSEETVPKSTLDGFTLANVSVIGFQSDGVVLTGVKNFLISHVTATNNGDYGLFPIFSSNGAVVGSSASGSNDTGIYVGQSRNVVVSGDEASGNVNGIEIENSTNCGAVANNVHDNTVGILEDFLPGLPIETSTGTFIIANRVQHNNRANSASPGDIAAAEPSGIGIAVVGGDHTFVAGNLVTGNNLFGIAVLTLADVVNPLPAPYPPGVDPNPNYTLVIGNVVIGNGVDLGWTGTGQHNQWIGNVYKTANTKLPL